MCTPSCFSIMCLIRLLTEDKFNSSLNQIRCHRHTVITLDHQMIELKNHQQKHLLRIRSSFQWEIMVIEKKNKKIKINNFHF